MKFHFNLIFFFLLVLDHLCDLIFLCVKIDVGADVLDLAETMVASADGLIYEPVS